MQTIAFFPIKNVKHFSGREDLTGSSQTSSSLPGGLNPQVATTSSSSSLLPTMKDLPDSSSSNNIFHAVPPLLSSTDQRQWNQEVSAPNQSTDEVRVRYRQRTSSVASRQVWQDGEVMQSTKDISHLPGKHLVPSLSRLPHPNMATESFNAIAESVVKTKRVLFILDIILQ